MPVHVHVHVPIRHGKGPGVTETAGPLGITSGYAVPVHVQLQAKLCLSMSRNPSTLALPLSR